MASNFFPAHLNNINAVRQELQAQFTMGQPAVAVETDHIRAPAAPCETQYAHSVLKNLRDKCTAQGSNSNHGGLDQMLSLEVKKCRQKVERGQEKLEELGAGQVVSNL